MKTHEVESSACIFVKMSLHNRCFAVNFTRLLITAILQNTFGRLLLYKEPQVAFDRALK